jgi:hypothetical protein
MLFVRPAAVRPPSYDDFDLGSDLAQVRRASYQSYAIEVQTLVVIGLNIGLTSPRSA